MRTLVLVAFGALLLAGGASALAAQQEKGDKEIGMSVNITGTSSSGGGSSASGTFGGSLGYFLTRLLKINTALFVTVSSPSGSSTTITPLVFVGASYSLGSENSKLFPYIGADALFIFVPSQEVDNGFGGTTSTDSQTLTQFSPNIGLNAYLKRNVALNAQSSFYKQGDVTTVVTTLGFRFIF